MIKRVLVIMNTLSMGGAETFIMKVFRCLDKEKYVFDFLINTTNNNVYETEVVSLGSKVFHGIPKSKNPIKSFLTIRNIVKNEHYTSVFSVAVHPLGFIDLLAAKFGGAKTLTVRSTTSQTGGVISKVLATLSRPFMRNIAHNMIAPSIVAAKWLYGDTAVIKGSVHILNNGVDTSKFVFSEEKRESTRCLLGIANEQLLVGHIGRFCKVKNHKKVVDTFVKILEVKPSSVLVLVGDGDDKEQIVQYSKVRGIRDSILILGIRNDIPELLCAFDVMLFPSFYEGMPNTIIEAQAVDLPCVISDTITRDVNITNEVIYVSLDSSDEQWANKVVNSKKSKRHNNSALIDKAGFSIQNTVNTLVCML